MKGAALPIMNEETYNLPKGLTLEEGISNEIAISKLTEAKIPHVVRWEKTSQRVPYFRSSAISINKQNERRVNEVLGFPDNILLNSQSYFSAYKIGDDFDKSQLSGNLTFHKGRLVERVMVYFENRIPL